MSKIHVLNSLMKTYRKTHKEIQEYMVYILDYNTYLLYYDTSVCIPNFEDFHVWIFYDCLSIPIAI
jgi:hypothetical protein